MELDIIARFHALAGHEGDMERAIRDVSGPTRAEPGCLDYHVYVSLRDPGLFYIHSRWTDEAAFELHAGLPHTLRFLDQVGRLTTHPLDVTRAKVII